MNARRLNELQLFAGQLTKLTIINFWDNDPVDKRATF